MKKKASKGLVYEKYFFYSAWNLPKNNIISTTLFIILNPIFSLSSNLSLYIKTSPYFITENAKGNLFFWKYYLIKGILQFTVFFDHPVA